jgi:hypothetical protein
MLRVTFRRQTNWWKSFVDGTNPEDEGRKLVSKFFRQHGIDPYGLEHAVINDWKRWLLIEINDPIGKQKGKGGPKAIGVGMQKLAELKRFDLARLKRDFPLSKSDDHSFASE